MAKLHKAIIYSGMAAFFFLCLAAFVGLAHLSYRLHVACGIAAFTFSSIHVGLIIFRNQKIKKKRGGK